jgi:hypothetical protein
MHMPTATALVLGARQLAEPGGDRRRAPERHRGELARDAAAQHLARRVARSHASARRAEQRRQHRGEPGGGDLATELGDLRRDARHLVHHDHGRARAAAVDVAGRVQRGERSELEPVERYSHSIVPGGFDVMS